jgi:hypothetical protein
MQILDSAKMDNTMKKKTPKNHTVRTVPKSNIKIAERSQIDTQS